MNIQRFVELAKESNVFHEGEVKDIDGIAKLLSPEKPLLYWTMEFYDKDEKVAAGLVFWRQIRAAPRSNLACQWW